MQPVLSILLATFAGFGVAMSGSSIIVEVLRWRRRWQASSNLHDNLQFASRRPQTAVSSHVDPPPLTQTETENPETVSGR